MMWVCLCFPRHIHSSWSTVMALLCSTQACFLYFFYKVCNRAQERISYQYIRTISFIISSNDWVWYLFTLVDSAQAVGSQSPAIRGDHSKSFKWDVLQPSLMPYTMAYRLWPSVHSNCVETRPTLGREQDHPTKS